MTKCKVLPIQGSKKKILKLTKIPIKFLYYIASNKQTYKIGAGEFYPSQYKYVDLIARGSFKGATGTNELLDFMVAYNKDRNSDDPLFVFGYWNDGVVE